MVKLPSVKYMMERLETLEGKLVTKEQAKQIRTLMETYEDKHSFRRPTPNVTLGKIDKILNGHGVESIPKGHNQKSPEITYVNMGDTYDVTVMWVNGRFVIGDWGSIVERGNYD